MWLHGGLMVGMGPCPLGLPSPCRRRWLGRPSEPRSPEAHPPPVSAACTATDGARRPPAVDSGGLALVRAPLHPCSAPGWKGRSGAKNLEQHSQTFVESMSEQGASGDRAPSVRRVPGQGHPGQKSASPKGRVRTGRESVGTWLSVGWGAGWWAWVAGSRRGPGYKIPR